MIEDMRDRYIIACWAYSIGEPIMEDAEFDALRLRIKKQDPKLGAVSWSDHNCPVALLKKYTMTDLIRKVVLSADKTTSMESINDIDSLFREYGGQKEEITLSVKYDGWNIQLFYFDNFLLSAKTRGRTHDFMFLENLLPYLPRRISVGGKVRITGEAVLSEGSFITLCAENPRKALTSRRAAVSSALTSPEAARHITFIAFRFEKIGGGEMFLTKQEEFAFLGSLGFQIPFYKTVMSFNIVQELEAFSNLCEELTFPSDGAVVSAKGKDLKALRLFRWAQQYYTSTVVGYVQEWGLTEISTKLQIGPVYVNGSRHTTLDIDNPARIKELRLKKGSPVAFTLVSHAVEKILPEMTLAL